MEDRIERLFTSIDNLFDEGCVDVVREVRSNEALRKQCNRLFPPKKDKSSTTLALEAYGLRFDTYVPNRKELENCLFIGEDYKVEVDIYRYNELLVCCNIDQSDLDDLLRPIKTELRLEALSNFVRETSPDMISYSSLREYPHLRVLVEQDLGGIEKFRERFNLDKRMVFYANTSKTRSLINNGFYFEELLENHLFGKVNAQVTYKDSRPDFVVEGNWFDAKLSKGTALFHKVNTIPKYLEHTDHLTIIYAYDDGADTSEVESLYNVDFVHVSEYYDLMSAEAVAEFEDLIERVGVLKGRSI